MLPFTTPIQGSVRREFLTALCGSMVEISVNHPKSTFLLTGRVTGLLKYSDGNDAGFNYVELEIRKKLDDRGGQPRFYRLLIKRRKVTPANTAKI